MVIFANFLRLLLIFPAVIAGIICSIALVFSLITPIMIIPCLLASIAIAYIYFHLFKLCALVAQNKHFKSSKSLLTMIISSSVLGFATIGYMAQYLNKIDLILFYPDVVFTLASVSHTIGSIVLMVWYSKNKT